MAAIQVCKRMSGVAGVTGLVVVLLTSSLVRGEVAFERTPSPKDSAPVFFTDDSSRLSFADETKPVVEGEAPAPGTPGTPPPPVPGYVGGRGLVSLQGMSGMLINPTSGTLQQGQLTVQWCLLINDDVLGGNGQSVGVDALGNGVMAAYGVTDWIEVGGYLLHVIADPSPFKGNGDDETLMIGGPFARIRIIKDEEWWPEIGVGAIYLDGDSSSDLLSRQEVFIAASKYFSIDPDGILKGVRVHGGVRFVWRHDALPGIEANGVVGFVGAEVELPYSIWLMAEVSSQDDTLGPRTPFAFGAQWRPNNVVGITIGAMQTGDAGRLCFYFGIGLNWKF